MATISFNCVCGIKSPNKVIEYDGGLGYEALICAHCGSFHDHTGEHPATPWSIKLIKARRNGSTRVVLDNQERIDRYTLCIHCEIKGNKEFYYALCGDIPDIQEYGATREDALLKLKVRLQALKDAADENEELLPMPTQYLHVMKQAEQALVQLEDSETPFFEGMKALANKQYAKAIKLLKASETSFYAGMGTLTTLVRGNLPSKGI